MGIRFRPVPGLMLEGSIEGGLGGTRSPGRARWSERLLLSASRSNIGRIVLRLQQRTEEEMIPWAGMARSESRLLAIRLESPATLDTVGRLEFKVAEDEGEKRSVGGWGELSVWKRTWQFWARITRTVVADGVPIYWYERVPAGAWGLRAVWKEEVRIGFGVSRRPEGWHVQAAVGPGGQAELRAGWRLRGPAGPRQ